MKCCSLALEYSWRQIYACDSPLPGFTVGLFCHFEAISSLLCVGQILMNALKRIFMYSMSHITWRDDFIPLYCIVCCLVCAWENSGYYVGPLTFQESILYRHSKHITIDEDIDSFSPEVICWVVPCGVIIRTIVCVTSDWYEDGVVAAFVSRALLHASSHCRVPPFSSHLGGTRRLLGPTLLQRQVSCIRRNPHTLLTRMQLAHTQTHTQTCRHTTDSNLACMITATLSCLGVLSHLALVFVAYPAACPAARIHRI